MKGHDVDMDKAQIDKATRLPKANETPSEKALRLKKRLAWNLSISEDDQSFLANQSFLADEVNINSPTKTKVNPFVGGAWWVWQIYKSPIGIAFVLGSLYFTKGDFLGLLYCTLIIYLVWTIVFSIDWSGK